jgi:hypothetical protein
VTVSPEVEAFETEMLRAFVETVDGVRDLLASADFTPETPRVRRWNEDDPAVYGSEIEMSLLRNGEINDVLDVLLYVRGERQSLTADGLKAWLTEQLEELAKPQA